MNEKNSFEKSKKDNTNKRLLITIIIMTIIIIVQTIYIINPTLIKINNQEKKQILSNLENEEITALVNGEPIYAYELIKAFEIVPQELKNENTLNETKEILINNKLLLQDASKNNLKIPEKEIDETITSFVEQNKITIEDLNQKIMNTGSNMNQFREEIKKDLLLKKEIELITREIKNPTETDLKLYYQAAKENLISLPFAEIKQIMVYADESNDKEQFLKIKEIASMLDNTNFCELAKKYSEDTPTAEKCGEYIFNQGQLLPEFESVVFNSSIGDVKLFKTRIGYHIVHIINKSISRQLEFDEVKENIKNYFIIANKQTALNDYLISLKEKAEIKIY
jgi:parvulin-like peptidyl-prolyl isomerase